MIQRKLEQDLSRNSTKEKHKGQSKERKKKKKQQRKVTQQIFATEQMKTMTSMMAKIKTLE